MRRLFFTSVLFFCTSSFAQISNMIVFGDSLSDGGNFPESSHIWKNPDAAKILSNAVPELYVPFSNPVDSNLLDNTYLPKQALLGNNKNPRKYRSISWPQYFLYETTLAKITRSNIIVPSNLLNKRSDIPKQFSFNYAWGYSVSDRSCSNPQYQPFHSCDAQSIFISRKNYEENPTQENYLKLQIPGLFEQVHLFLKDRADNKVVVDQHTLYAFWTGGNDLIIASNAFREHWNPLPALQFMSGSTASHVIKNVSALIQGLPINERPKIIYVFNLFNPELTPGFHQTDIAKIANVFVKCCNFWLRWDSYLFNLFSSTKIVIVPTYQWFQESAGDLVFKSRMGEACQIQGGDYENPLVTPKSNCAGFMFWNGVHPATTMNAVLSKRFFAFTETR